MDLIDVLLTAFAVFLGLVSRDFFMGAVIAWRTKAEQKKKVAELDKYYQALLDAEAAESADESA